MPRAEPSHQNSRQKPKLRESSSQKKITKIRAQIFAGREKVDFK